MKFGFIFWLIFLGAAITFIWTSNCEFAQWYRHWMIVRFKIAGILVPIMILIIIGLKTFNHDRGRIR